MASCNSDDAPAATLVLAGTHEVRFERLEGAVEWAANAQRLPLPALLQTGVSGDAEASGEVRRVGFLDHDELLGIAKGAQVIITHGGPGSIFLAREAGHRPIVFPRRAEYGEHVDDHQSGFGQLLASAGEVLLAADRHDLEAILAKCRSTKMVSGAWSLADNHAAFLTGLRDVLRQIGWDRKDASADGER